MYKELFAALALIVFFNLNTSAQKAPVNKIENEKDYEVAVYYFPNYHPDSINTRWHGKGWTEWDVVKAAKPRFKGHEQPKFPHGATLMKPTPNGRPKKLT